MKILLTLFVLFFSSSYLYAKPMWEISDYWNCNVTLHTKITVDGSVVGVNDELYNTSPHFYDFKNLKASSAWSNSEGVIVDKFYIENMSYNQNIIIVNWSGWGEIVSVIHEDKGEFWDTASSGFNAADRIIWSSTSKCFTN